MAENLTYKTPVLDLLSEATKKVGAPLVESKEEVETVEEKAKGYGESSAYDRDYKMGKDGKKMYYKKDKDGKMYYMDGDKKMYKESDDVVEEEEQAPVGSKFNELFNQYYSDEPEEVVEEKKGDYKKGSKEYKEYKDKKGKGKMYAEMDEMEMSDEMHMTPVPTAILEELMYYLEDAMEVSEPDFEELEEAYDSNGKPYVKGDSLSKSTMNKGMQKQPSTVSGVAGKAQYYGNMSGRDGRPMVLAMALKSAMNSGSGYQKSGKASYVGKKPLSS